MNKHILFLATFSAMALAAVVLVPQAQALTIEQHQVIDNESHSECSGDCKHTFSFSSSQRQVVDTGDSRSDWRLDSSRAGFSDDIDWEDDRDGNVRFRWNVRGGTCTIRYGEASSRSYPYSTTAACDEGSTTIGGLVPGRAYRFQVKKDDGVWSRPMRMVAW